MCDSEWRWPGEAFTLLSSREGLPPRKHPPSADKDAPGGRRRALEREYSYAAATVVVIIPPIMALLS
jgi:hypothetical protein